MPTAATEGAQAAESSERAAAAASLRALLRPRSVAVVGASERPGSLGGLLFRHVIEAGYRGDLHPINPAAAEVFGRRAFASIGAIGAPVDLALIAVPAPQVEDVVRDCALAGVRGVVVISAGFGEVSAEGREAERRLRELARASGMRLVGPNCMGVLNSDPEVSLNAPFAPQPPPGGHIGMLSQSGALGVAVLDHARRHGLGVSSFVSAGNKADVSGNDLLCYWAEDDATHVILLYVESFGNPRRFARIARDVARRKPIVAVKSGRFAAATRAAASHSAALASLDVAVDALFEQAGVIRSETLEELFDVAALLSTQPPPAGARVAILTNAGGPAILLADACEARGLVLPSLAAETVEALTRRLPPAAAVANPVDMLASAGAAEYERTLPLLGNDPNVDAVVVVHIPLLPSDAEDVAAAIARGAARVPAAKPVLAVLHSATGAVPTLEAGARGRLPVYRFPENAARALAAAERRGAWLRRPRGRLLELDAGSKAALRAVVERALEGRSAPFWLAPDEAAALLRAAGIPYAETRCVPPAQAVAASLEMGFPLVLKAVAAGLLHKSELGGVVLGLRSAADVAAALEALQQRLRGAGLALRAVLLQREIEGGVEALVGVTSDPVFGPLVVCGLGGVLVELLRDASFRLQPVSDVDAEEMIERLRARRLLEGYRGAPVADRAALARVIQQVSALVDAVPELREMDLNPVRVLGAGRGAVAVDVRVRLAP